MSNCANCGNPLDASSSRCTRCGAMVTNQSQGQRSTGYTSTQQIAYPKETRRESHGIPVSVLTLLSAVSGLESFLYVAKLNLNPRIPELGQLSAISSYTPYILGVAGVLAFAASFGYLKKIRLAWKLGVLSAVVSAFTIVAPNLIGFLLGVVCLGLLFTPSIRSALRH